MILRCTASGRRLALALRCHVTFAIPLISVLLASPNHLGSEAQDNVEEWLRWPHRLIQLSPEEVPAVLRERSGKISGLSLKPPEPRKSEFETSAEYEARLHAWRSGTKAAMAGTIWREIAGTRYLVRTTASLGQYDAEAGAFQKLEVFLTCGPEFHTVNGKKLAFGDLLVNHGQSDVSFERWTGLQGRRGLAIVLRPVRVDRNLARQWRERERSLVGEAQFVVGKPDHCWSGPGAHECANVLLYDLRVSFVDSGEDIFSWRGRTRP